MRNRVSNSLATTASAGVKFLAIALREARVWPSVAAVLLIATLSMGYVLIPRPIVALFADHRTGKGEIETVALPDGSVVVMNAQSAIDVRFDASARSIQLLRGEADFVVAPDQTRPFTVTSGEMGVRALGTRFVVQQRSAGSKVSVLDHRVEVSVEAGDAKRLVLGPGMSVTVSVDGILSPITEESAANVTAWQQGRLVFDRLPLAEVLHEIDRYQGGRTVLLRKNLENKTVSGVFHIDNLETALDSIAKELDLERMQVLPGIAILH